MIRTGLAAAGIAALLVTGLPAAAVDSPAEPMPLPLAREVVGQTIELVESRGVHARRQDDYDRARAALLATLGGAGEEQVDRKAVYGGIRALLATLDADGHSFLVPAMPAQNPQPPTAGSERGAQHPPAFSLVSTGRGTVLRWTPPPIQGGADVFDPYIRRFYDEAEAHPGIKAACALVVDLSEQTGGNAWPPFIAMYPLFGDANTARLVDRDGKRVPFVDRRGLEATARAGAAGRANPLAPYAAGPLAVVVGSRTASAGEMLLVALLGERKVQTFGQTSYGLSTSNMTHPLADGSTLVLTEMRYALGDGPVYRGGIPAMHPLERGEALDAALRAAAEWAAASTPACREAPRVAGAQP